VEAGLQLHQGLIKKVIQLYETKLTRHGTMVVGKTGSGKSTCWKTLQRALSRLKKVCTCYTIFLRKIGKWRNLHMAKCLFFCLVCILALEKDSFVNGREIIEKLKLIVLFSQQAQLKTMCGRTEVV